MFEMAYLWKSHQNDVILLLFHWPAIVDHISGHKMWHVAHFVVESQLFFTVKIRLY